MACTANWVSFKPGVFGEVQKACVSLFQFVGKRSEPCFGGKNTVVLASGKGDDTLEYSRDPLSISPLEQSDSYRT